MTNSIEIQESAQIQQVASNQQESSIEENIITRCDKTATKLPADSLKVPVVQERYRARTGSVVSFKEHCKMYEIDLENERRRRIGKPPAVFSLRYYIMFLALFSPLVVTYSKTIINFAMTDMINPDFLTTKNHVSTSKSTTTTTTTTTTTLSPEAASVSMTPAPYHIDINLTQTNGDYSSIETTSTTTIDSTTAPESTSYYFETDNSCMVDNETRQRLIDELNRGRNQSRGTQGEKFDWDTLKQGYLKAAYAIGHIALQVAGGRLSEIYGSHLIMCTSSMLIGLACLAAPFLASLQFWLMFLDLFLLGILGSFMTPALITLMSNWLTPSEKALTLSLYLVSSRLGSALSSFLCGLLIDAKLSWRYLFYTAGWTSIVFSSLFWLIARSRPHQHPYIQEQELWYLASKNTLVREAIMAEENERAKTKEQDIEMSETTDKIDDKRKDNRMSEKVADKKSSSAPWLAILTSGPVWAFVITKFCVKSAGDTLQNELPVYFKRVMHLTPKKNGSINAWNYVIFCASCLIVGALAKTANKRHPFGLSKTATRKLFQCTASFGVGTMLLLLSSVVCMENYTIAILMMIFFLTTFSTGGEAQIPLDISERYAGTIHAIGSSLSISGAIVPILVGKLLQGAPADRDRWRYVWWGASAFAYTGGSVFLLFGDAKIQPFDQINENKAKEKTEEKKEQMGKEVKLKMEAHENKSFEVDFTNASGEKVTKQESDRSHRESKQI